MIRELIFGKTSIPILRKMLDASSLRHKTIASNVANIMTPGYRRTEVSFEEELRRAMSPHQLTGARTDPRHLSIGKTGVESVRPRVYKPDDETLPSGINNVDIDKEMAALAQNQLTFYTSAKLLAMRINAIKMSIKGRT